MKLKGIFRKSTPEETSYYKDPWRESAKELANATDTSGSKVTSKTSKITTAVDSDNADDTSQQQVTLHFKNYGGITIKDADSNGAAALIMLNTLVDNEEEVSDVLLNYGLILTKLDSAPPSKFFIQRDDGWTLAAPDVPSRDIGFFQFIQALLELKTRDKIGKQMKEKGICPFKM